MVNGAPEAPLEGGKVCISQEGLPRLAKGFAWIRLDLFGVDHRKWRRSGDTGTSD
jgi:hypothetical protein